MNKTLSVIALSAFAATLWGAPRKHALYEPETPDAKPSAVTENLFTGAKVTASGSFEKFKPELAIDGKINPNEYWACENLPVWIQIDMGKVRSLSALKIFPYWADGRIYQYKAEGSADGQKWVMLADMTANSIAASAEGQIFSFPAENVRYVKLTFIGNSAGAKAGGHLVEIQGFDAPVSNEPIVLSAVSAFERFAKNTPLSVKKSPEGPEPVRLSGWQGEQLYAQILIRANTNIRELSAELEGVSGKVNFIRYTLSNNKLNPDILDNAESLPLEAGTVRPLWLTFTLPADALSGGVQSGKLKVHADGFTAELPVELTVEAGILPPPSEWSIHLDLWQHPDAVARWHDVPMWSNEHFALMKKYFKRLADMGQKSITCTLIDDAWNGQTYDVFGSMVGITKKKDGSWAYDYTNLDRYVTMMRGLGITGQIDCYTMIPWHLKFRYFDEASNSFEAPKLNPGTEAYEAFWGPYLKDLQAHAKAKGWEKSLKLAMDERPDYMMRAAHTLVRKYAPELSIVGAFDRPTKLTDSVENISLSIQHTDDLTAQIKADRASKGYKTTLYTCCGPAKPNTFASSTLPESVWLFHYAAAQNLDGYLRWAYNSWVENPLVSTDFVTWPTGDCFLVYPGDRSSMRLELLRDGIEDYEKIAILRRDAAKDSREEVQNALKELNQELVGRYTYKRAKDLQNYQPDIDTIREKIAVLTRLVYTQ